MSHLATSCFHKVSYIIFLWASLSWAQQQPDTLFDVQIQNPRFTKAIAPVIRIDGMHHNLHQVDGNFAPFAQLARKDGYRVAKIQSYDQLQNTDLLVIANAIDQKNIRNWKRPIYPAFAKSEIEKIKNYVQQGGSLLLIADHMPFAGAANELAMAFGFDFCDGFAQLNTHKKGPDTFSLANGRLPKSVIVDGSLGVEIDQVISFTGSSFSIPPNATGVLKFEEGDTCLSPEVAWQFDEETPTSPLEDRYQGAIMSYGKGKIAVFGEAAMFTAQTIKQNGKTYKVGFNSYYAPQNVGFIRNLLYWLSKDISINAESLQSQIAAVNRKMEDTFDNQGPAQVSTFYTTDGIMLGGNDIEVVGRANLRSYWGKFSGDLQWELESIEVRPLGAGHALQRGYSNVYYKKQDGTDGHSRSIFTLIWKETDQGWKILLDHFSDR